MFLAGSRYVSQWLNLSATTISSMDLYMEGSPIDRAVFLFLIAASVVVLLQRKLNWSEIIKNNPWIWLYFLYALISIFWSDYPFVSFKRWIKTLGTVSIALIILTEERPYEAFGVILRRLAFLLLPFSVLFIKYYPNLGRGYTVSGMAMYTGVTFQKNSLGEICLIFGIYFCWNLLFKRREEIELGSRLHFSIYLIFLPMIAWLLYMANSATSLVCLVVAICFFLASRVPAVVREPRRIIAITITFFVLFGVLELFFDMTGAVIAMLGRDQNLTSRVPIWNELLAMVKNPIIGVGYEIFWAGERMTQLWEKIGADITNSHNGYLDIYLNIGIVGLCLMLISIVAGVTKAIRHLNHEYAYAILRILLIIVVVLQNWTEATFKPLSNMFVLLLVGILEVPGSKNDQEEQ